MTKMINITNQRFEKLVALEPTKKRCGASVVWRCICDCGNEHFASSDNLRRGHVKSCGCLRRDTARKNTKHEHARKNCITPEYRAWQHMISRCENPNTPDWDNYGGRGIQVSGEFHDFQTWYEHIGPRPNSKYSQDRWPDNNGNYERSNIRWTTRCGQANNTRKNRLFIACGPCGQIEVAKNQQAFARKWELSVTTICACLNERAKTHKKWHFEYIREYIK